MQNRAHRAPEGGQEWPYLYDNNGIRVKKTSNSVATYYVNQFYAPSGIPSGPAQGKLRRPTDRDGERQHPHLPSWRPSFGKLRTSLGRTVLETNTSGTAVGNMGYYAYGRYRNGSNFSTEHKFTLALSLSKGAEVREHGITVLQCAVL